MFFAWLKRFTPRSLYGRAAMILLVPIVTIQLVVTVVFVQRHYEGITRQMTDTLSGEIDYVLGEIAATPDLAAAQRVLDGLQAPLALDARLPVPAETGDALEFYDLSGRALISGLRADLPGVTAVDLVSDPRSLRMVIETAHGPMELSVPRRRVTATAPHQLLVLMAFTSALMTLIAFVFLRNQLRPVKRLAEAAEAFGRGRVVPYRPTGATEMRSAGMAFLDMRARIERMIEQRTLMLSGVSHDLRTPLTRLRLELSMLPDEETEPMRRDIADMERLIDSFLDFARGDAAEEPVPADPAAIVRQAAADAVRTGGAVTLAEVEETGEMLLRPAAVRRALDNLVGNALRYAGRAELSLHGGARAVRLVVEDDGPGIPEERREDAVRPFIRLDSARNQDLGSGVGLGLAIARDIARRHGGTLRLSESERLGGLKAEIVLAR